MPSPKSDLYSNDMANSKKENIADLNVALHLLAKRTLVIQAYFGLLYFLGDFKSGHEDLRSLWATNVTGRDIFRCTMPLARFSFLLCYLQFDSEETRENRIKENKLAVTGILPWSLSMS